MTAQAKPITTAQVVKPATNLPDDELDDEDLEPADDDSGEDW